MVMLQVLIAATGNYGFFNLLAIVLCLSVLDDRDSGALGDRASRRHEAARRGRDIHEPLAAGRGRGGPSWACSGGILVAVTGAQTIETVPAARGGPDARADAGAVIEPLRSTNSYGLFRVMTTERPEITVEGSDDG